MGDKLRGGTTIGGNIAYHAGNIPTWNQDTTGNAGTSTKLATARTIALSGDVGGSTSFDGSGNVSITTTVADDSHNHTFANLTSTPATATRWPTFAEVSGKPTTFTPSAHTHDDRYYTQGQSNGLYVAKSSLSVGNSSSGIANPDDVKVNAITYSIGTAAAGFTDGAIYSQFYSDVWGHQIFGNYRTGDISARGRNNGVWTPWVTYYHSGNLPAQAPTNLGITAGTTVGPTVTSSTGTNATLPTASATASGVLTTGAQTIAGVKTFSSAITGSVTGNAGTSTKLATARTINGVSFDGTANITIASGYNILTTEYLTGFSRNGVTIYGIEVNLGAMPNTSFKDVSFTFNSAYTYWIDNQNSYCSNTTASYPLNFTGNIGESISCYLDRTNNKIKILCSDNKSTFTGKIVILYTK